MLNYNKTNLAQVNINPEHMIQLIKLLEQKEITELNAKDILRSWKSGSKAVKTSSISKIDDLGKIAEIIDQVISENEKAVADFKSGNKQSINFLIGQVMNKSNKRADFQTAKDLLEKKLR
jgi:aspartyl-tRNA(Asn)/glutamyl-tRNA(Gln) amidotransferase subunit B